MESVNRSSSAEKRNQQSTVIVDYNARKKYRRDVIGLSFKILLVFAFALVVLLRYASITEIGHKVNQSQKQYEACQEENRRLNKELAAYSDIEMLRDIAEKKFGMGLPKEEQKVYIEPMSYDRTDLYNIELTEEKEEYSVKTGLLERLKRFVGIL